MSKSLDYANHGVDLNQTNQLSSIAANHYEGEETHPRLSPDGKWQWNGTQWIPLPLLNDANSINEFSNSMIMSDVTPEITSSNLSKDNNVDSRGVIVDKITFPRKLSRKQLTMILIPALFGGLIVSLVLLLTPHEIVGKWYHVGGTDEDSMEFIDDGTVITSNGPGNSSSQIRTISIFQWSVEGDLLTISSDESSNEVDTDSEFVTIDYNSITSRYEISEQVLFIGLVSPWEIPDYDYLSCFALVNSDAIPEGYPPDGIIIDSIYSRATVPNWCTEIMN